MNSFTCFVTVPTSAHRTLAVFFSLLVLNAAHAQKVAEESALTPSDARLLEQYDINKNGKLDPDELEALRRDHPESALKENESSPKSDTVVLSPFQVNGGSDRGYFASSTLSGTRLNSSIEDLGASISVVTKEQLLDTAAVDINDIFKYEANTEGASQFTSVTYDRGFINDDVANSPQTANRIRGLSSANVALGSYYTSGAVPIDTYNVDSVEISRGPNSSIFGLGNASGTVNLNIAKANVTREISRIVARADSNGGYRGSFDFNRPLIENKLAVRVLGMHEDKGYVRKPSEDRTDRFQLGITFRPFKKTTIRATWEDYKELYQRPNTNTPREEVNAWIAAGSPTWDPITMTATVNGVKQAKPIPYSLENTGGLPAGLLSLANNNRPFLFIDGGSVQLLTVEHASPTAIPGGGSAVDLRYVNSGYVTAPLNTYPAVSSKSLYDWTKINYAAPNWGHLKARTFNIELEQNFLDTEHNLLALQAGFFKQISDNYTRTYIGNSDSASPVIFVDPNERLLDGRPNPYFLHPLIAGSAPRAKDYPENNFTNRLILAYQLDMSKERNWLRWLGRHRFSAYGEFRQDINAPAGILYRDQILDNHAWIAVGASRVNTADYQLYPRFYLGDGQGYNVDYAPRAPKTINGTYPYYWYNGVTKQWTTEDVQFGQTYAGNQKQKQQVRTEGIVWQGFFWKDRIIPTLGARVDRSRIVAGPSAPASVQDPNTRYYLDITPLDNFNQNNWNQVLGHTSQQGVVVKIFSWLNAQYNQSTSFVPATLAYNLFGEQLPNPTGKGKDYGITLKFFNNKLVFRANRYDTFEKDTRSGQGANAIRANNMDFSTGTLPNLFDRASGWIAAANPTWTTDQISNAAATYVGFSPEIKTAVTSVKSSLIDDVNDASSKGYEFELNYNPTAYWTMKLTAAQQQAINSNMSRAVQDYIDLRLPFWTTVKDPTTGNLWWTEPYNGTDTPQTYFNNQVYPNVQLAAAQQGKPRPQVREWRANFLTKLRLAGITQNTYLKNLDIGTSVRWEDKAAIGFLAGPPSPPDNLPHTLDANKPIYDKAREYVDLNIGYNLKLLGNRVRARVQLNINNLFENGRLQATGVNPDGVVTNYRIIDPRVFLLTTTFDL